MILTLQNVTCIIIYIYEVQCSNYIYMYCVQQIRVANKSILIILWKWCIWVCIYTKYLDHIKSSPSLQLSPNPHYNSLPTSSSAFMNFKPFRQFNFFFKSLLAWKLYIRLQHYMKLHTCILVEVTHPDNWQQALLLNVTWNTEKSRWYWHGSLIPSD